MERSPFTVTTKPFDRSLTITWHAAEHEPQSRPRGWFWGVSLVGMAGAALSLYLSNFLFGIIILLGAGIILLYSVRTPTMIRYSLSARGLQIDTHLFPFDNLESFWIHDLEDPIMMIKSKRTFMPLLTIPLVGINPNVVQEYLRHFLREEKQDIPFSHQISKALGF
jgi:hypothetical protein